MSVWERIIRIDERGTVTKEYCIHGHNITTVTGNAWSAAVKSGVEHRTVIEYPATFETVLVRSVKKRSERD